MKRLVDRAFCYPVKMRHGIALLLISVVVISCRKNDPRDQYVGNYNCTVINQQQSGTTWLIDTAQAVVPVVELGKSGNKMIVNGTTVTLSGSSFTEGVEHGLTGSFTGDNISFAIGPATSFSTYEGVKEQ